MKLGKTFHHVSIIIYGTKKITAEKTQMSDCFWRKPPGGARIVKRGPGCDLSRGGVPGGSISGGSILVGGGGQVPEHLCARPHPRVPQPDRRWPVAVWPRVRADPAAVVTARRCSGDGGSRGRGSARTAGDCEGERAELLGLGCDEVELGCSHVEHGARSAPGRPPMVASDNSAAAFDNTAHGRCRRRRQEPRPPRPGERRRSRRADRTQQEHPRRTFLAAAVPDHPHRASIHILGDNSRCCLLGLVLAFLSGVASLVFLGRSGERGECVRCVK